MNQNLLQDGDFDNSCVGTRPDSYRPAGRWREYQYPIYFDGTIGPPNEPAPEVFSTVDSATVAPGASGLCLRLSDNEFPATANLLLFHTLDEPIIEEPSTVVEFSFDCLVSVPGAGGIAVMLTENSALLSTSVGIANARLIQLNWRNTGALTANTLVAGALQIVTIVATYPIGIWQHVMVRLDLVTDTYDVFWAPQNQPLVLVASQLALRSGPVSKIESVYLACFSTAGPIVDSTVDNFVLEVVQR